MARNVSVSSRPLNYSQSISVGPHKLQSGEPSDIDRKNTRPDTQTNFRTRRLVS